MKQKLETVASNAILCKGTSPEQRYLHDNPEIPVLIQTLIDGSTNVICPYYKASKCTCSDEGTTYMDPAKCLYKK